MSLPVPDREPALARAEAAAGRFADLLRRVDDPTRTAIGEWDIAQTGTHVAHVLALRPRVAAGEGSPVPDHLALAEFWRTRLADDIERDPAAAAVRVERAIGSFVDTARGAAWDQEVPWHGGVPAPVYALAGIIVTECELHGLDVARAERRRWEIPHAHAAQGIQALFPIMRHFLKHDAAAGLLARYELRFRDAFTVFATLDDGTLVISADRPATIDCHISADPVEYLLVGYGRRSQVLPALTGKMMVWGRKPWLSFKFARLFESP